MKKSEVAEKVKEIKLRQQNWLKQRKEEKQSEAGAPVKQSPEDKSAHGVKSSSYKRKDSENSSSTRKYIQTRNVTIPGSTSQPPREINNVASDRKDCSNKFKSWLQTRTSKESKDDTSVQSKTYKITPAKSRDAAGRKVTTDVGSASSGKLLNLQTFTQTADRGQHSQLISPEQFNDLADKIVSKVKTDLCISQTRWSGEGDQMEKVSDDAHADTGDHLDRTLSSHHCGVCSKHMISTETMPMLLIPCGHNVCKSCSQGKSVCPVCHCSVTSSACNIMLQQIIQEYQGRVRSLGSRKQTNQSSYSPHKYTETKGMSYHDKLQTLLTRLEVLNEEKDSEMSNYTGLTADLGKQEQQLENISRQEASICRQISSLQEKLAILQQHKSEYQVQCSQVKQDKEEVRKRVAMLEDTIDSLCAEIDKVRLLSEGSRM